MAHFRVGNAQHGQQHDPCVGHVIRLARQAVDGLLRSLDQLLHQSALDCALVVAFDQTLQAAGRLAQGQPIVALRLLQFCRREGPLPSREDAGGNGEEQQHRDNSRDPPAAPELGAQRLLPGALDGGLALLLGGDRGLRIGDDLRIEVVAPQCQRLLGLGQAAARRQEKIAVPVMTLPGCRLGLQPPAHQQEVAVLLDQRGKPRPVAEQGLMRQTQRLPRPAVIGHGEARRHQAIGQLPLRGVDQRGAPNRAGGGGRRRLRLSLVHLHERQQERRERCQQLRREPLDQLVRMPRDGALETAELAIAAIGEDISAARRDVAAVELVEHEGQQRQ